MKQEVHRKWDKKACTVQNNQCTNRACVDLKPLQDKRKVEKIVDKVNVNLQWPTSDTIYGPNKSSKVKTFKTRGFADLQMNSQNRNQNWRKEK